MKKRFYIIFCFLSMNIFIYSSCSDVNSKSKNQTVNIPASQQTTEHTGNTKPKIQVVFLLDATGSMSGLINTAKEKIWSITSSMSQTKPAPDIEVGMLFYRDRGDSFITKIIPLGTEMDNLYEQLMIIQAEGGGDGPESVNQAIHEGVTKMQWDNLPDTYRTIFLVGDYPPHMDYIDDIKYPESCSMAKERNIIINTILMGNESTAARIWKEIASLTNGEYIQTDMNVNNIEVKTPYDDKISKLQYELDNTRVYYGESMDLIGKKQEQSEKLLKGDVGASARRAEYNLSETNKKVYYGSNELVNDVKNGKKLSDIPSSKLPDHLQKMSVNECQTYIDNLITKRGELEKEIVDLSKQRQDYISSELEKIDEDKVEKSFDNIIFKAVQEQAESKNIIIEGKAKR